MRKKSGKKIKTFLFVLLGIIILLLILLILPQKDFPYSDEDAERDALLSSEIAEIIADSIVDEEGNVPEIAEIIIPDTHADALFRNISQKLNLYIKHDINPNLQIQLAWESDSVKAYCAYNLPFSTAFAVQLKTMPNIGLGGEIVLNLKQLKIGYIPFPSGFNIPIPLDDHKEIQNAISAIKELHATKDGNILIRIYPEKVSSLLQALIAEN